MTMDLKEIIKWFIPCFHILLLFRKMDSVRLTLICLFLFFNCYASGARVNSVKDLDLSESIDDAKNIVNFEHNLSKFNDSDGLNGVLDTGRNLEDVSTGRTFGRPFKKMIGSLMPLIFQIGAASTWAVVAALVGVKTLVITLVILKLLLLAAATKFGALFAQKGHQSHGWEPHHPSKEIHLHIHNGHIAQGHEHEEHFSPWSRESTQLGLDTKNYNAVIEPYAYGPQTISTPFGNYVKVDSLQGLSKLTQK